MMCSSGMQYEVSHWPCSHQEYAWFSYSMSCLFSLPLISCVAPDMAATSTSMTTPWGAFSLRFYIRELNLLDDAQSLAQAPPATHVLCLCSLISGAKGWGAMTTMLIAFRRAIDVDHIMSTTGTDLVIDTPVFPQDARRSASQDIRRCGVL